MAASARCKKARKPGPSLFSVGALLAVRLRCSVCNSGLRRTERGHGSRRSRSARLCRNRGARHRSAERERSGRGRPGAARPRPRRHVRRECHGTGRPALGRGRLTRRRGLRRRAGHPGRHDTPRRRLEHPRRRRPRLVPARGPGAAACRRLGVVASGRGRGPGRGGPSRDPRAGRTDRRRQLGDAERTARARAASSGRPVALVARRAPARADAVARGLRRGHVVPDRLGRSRSRPTRRRRGPDAAAAVDHVDDDHHGRPSDPGRNRLLRLQPRPPRRRGPPHRPRPSRSRPSTPR